jgi:hypothetical protein
MCRKVETTPLNFKLNTLIVTVILSAGLLNEEYVGLFWSGPNLTLNNVSLLGLLAKIKV